MNTRVLLLCFYICFKSYAYDELLIQSYIDEINHYDLADDGFTLKKSHLPNILRDELVQILRGPLGPRILELKDDLRPSFVMVHDPKNAFLVSDEKIYYMKDVHAWYSYKKISLDIPKGSNLDIATLGTLLSHEIGHTELGRRALNLSYINSFKEVRTDVGHVTFVFSRQKVYEEEYRAVYLFENPFREFIGIAPRESYYQEGDVINYSTR